jgi:hypothetical protein
LRRSRAAGTAAAWIFWAEHQAILDRIEAEKNAPRPAVVPRIRRL